MGMFQIEDVDFKEIGISTKRFKNISKEIFGLFDFVSDNIEVCQVALADEGEGVYVLFIWEKTLNYPYEPDTVEVYAYDIDPQKIKLIKDPRDYTYYYSVVTECARRLLTLATSIKNKSFDMIVVSGDAVGKCKLGEYSISEGEDFADLNLTGVKSVMGIVLGSRYER